MNEKEERIYELIEKIDDLKVENFELRQTISALEEEINWMEKFEKKLNDDYCLLEDKHRQVLNIIKILESHMLLASGLCEIKLADEEVSKLHPKYHNGKEVYEPKYNEFYFSLKEILEVLNEKN